VLLLGRDENDPLFLQIKEAEASVLEPFVGSGYKDHRQRVVEGQRLMQSASEIFLGWSRDSGFDRIAIAAYLGSKDVFDRAIVEFALAYRDQNTRDHAAVAAAAQGGRLAVV
jgi:hypothetical protein